MFPYKFLTTFNFVVYSVFFGFCLWSFFWIFRRRKEWRFYFSVDEIDKVIVKTVIAGTIGNLLIVFYEVIVMWYNGIAFESFAFTERMTGPYWFGYWINTFVYYLFPFLFWIKKMGRSTAFRIIAVVLICYVLFFEKFVIIITSVHRDYSPASATLKLLVDFLLTLLLKLITFVALIAALLAIKRLRNNKPSVPN